MTRKMIALAALVTTAFVPAPSALAGLDAGWDVTKPRGATRTIDFETSIGTWMSTDISPDGKWILFDLLAHIYRVPVAGGEAEVLTQDSGIAINYRPRYSPDGKWIAFISDRGGQANLWIMDADGSNPYPLFTDRDRNIVEAAWSADSETLAVTIANAPGYGGETGLFLYPRRGGEGRKLASDISWPSFSRDGRFLYYMYRQTMETNQGAALPSLIGGQQQVGRLTLADGERFAVTRGIDGSQLRRSSGGAIAPEISPDGRWLAFSRRVPGGKIRYKGHEFGPRSSLWLRNLEDGSERMLVDPIEQDLAEGASGKSRVLPHYSWSADGQWIVLSQGGKLRRVEVATGKVSTIPFTARVRRVISEQAIHKFRIDDKPFKVRFPRSATVSPDGSSLAFHAGGRLWLGGKDGDKPRRITPPDFGPLEYGAAWSPDGRWLVFTSFGEKEGGHVWRVRATGGKPERLTRKPGEYASPVWSPDGRTVYVLRGAGATRRGGALADNGWFDIAALDPARGTLRDIVRVPTAQPAGSGQFPRDMLQPIVRGDGRIAYSERREEEQSVRLMSIRPDGTGKRIEASLKPASTRDGMPDNLILSPDGTRVAYSEYGNVFVATLAPRTGDAAAAIDPAAAKQLTRTGGLEPHWIDGDRVGYLSGGDYFVHDLRTGTSIARAIDLELDRDIPKGSIALRNARIVTLGKGGTFEKGDVVIRGSRIACVGDCSTVPAERDLDLAGKTLVPGFIDMHAHIYGEYLGMTPPHGADNAIYLAYGVTTIMDPAANSSQIFTARELIDAGQAIGPRIFSTGEPLNGSNPLLDDYQTVEDSARKLRSWGATALKQYAQPRRIQRQWTTEAARRLGLNVTAESMDLYYNIAQIMDGQTGVEHMNAYLPIYSDVAQFFGKASYCYSPTLQGSGGGPWNGQYWWAKSDLAADPKQQLWVPWRKLWPAARRPVQRPDSDYSFPIAAQGLADVIAEGGCGVIGGHNLQPGLASHWDIWETASAMPNEEALKVASLHGARFLGAEQDLGSIEPGKLADLVILNSNPLENIRATADIGGVMKGGVLYDEKLDEVWPRQRAFGTYGWRVPEMFVRDVIDITPP